MISCHLIFSQQLLQVLSDFNDAWRVGCCQVMQLLDSRLDNNLLLL